MSRPVNACRPPGRRKRPAGLATHLPWVILACLGLVLPGALQAAETPAQQVRKWLDILLDEAKPDDGPQGRMAARQHLVQLGGIAVMPMVEALKRPPSANARLQIAMAMRGIGERDPESLRRAVKPLARLLEHPSFGVRYWAAKALAVAARERLAAAVPLLKAVENSDEMLRENVVRCLGELSFVEPWPARKRLTAALVARMKDTHPRVRATAVAALAAYREWRRIPQMLPLVHDGNVLVQTAATEALEGMTGLSFDFHLDDSPEGRREKWKAWIRKWGAQLKAERTALLAQLKDPDPTRRRDAARELRLFRGTGVVQALVPALADPVVSVQDAAVRSLEAITESNFGLTPKDPPAVRKQKIQDWLRQHGPSKPKAKKE